MEYKLSGFNLLSIAAVLLCTWGAINTGVRGQYGAMIINIVLVLINLFALIISVRENNKVIQNVRQKQKIKADKASKN